MMKKSVLRLSVLTILLCTVLLVSAGTAYAAGYNHIHNITFIPIIKNTSGNGYSQIGQSTEIVVQEAYCSDDYCGYNSSNGSSDYLSFEYLNSIYNQLTQQEALNNYKFVAFTNLQKDFSITSGGRTFDDVDKIIKAKDGATMVYTNNEKFYFIFAAKPKYTITYTDGVDNAVIFEDQVHLNVLEGSATPQFDNGVDDTHIPKRVGYTFTSWAPTPSANVTGSRTYVAQWNKNPAPTLPTDDDLKKLLGSVKVTCTNADVSHAAKAYDLLADSYTATLKEVTDGVYTVYTAVLTVRPAQYVALFNQDHGVEHTLVSDAGATVYLVYDWDSNSWKLDMPAEADADASVFSIEFKVVCTTPTSDPTSEPTPKPTPIPGSGNGNGGTGIGGPGSSAPSGSSSSLPKTGDASMLSLFVMALAASLAALSFLQMAKAKKES